MVPILLEALKEQNTIIEAQNGTIESQNAKIAAIEKSLAALRLESGTTVQDDVLNTEAILHQNRPNPFTISTSIDYELPETAQSAQMVIYDMQGHQLMDFNALKTGKGSVKIAGATLTSGMYMYALIADGKIVDTKRMILTK